MNSSKLYETMAPKAKNIHYLKRYLKFIDSCVNANVDLETTVYTEKHHILPKSKQFWPEYANLQRNKWNRVDLTARQHVIAHWILAKALGGAMNTAFWSMVNGKCDHYRKGVKFNSRMVAIAREMHGKNHSKKLKEFYDNNPEARQKVSDRVKGESNPFYGKTHSDEVIQYLREINTGKTVSEEVREKISLGLMGREVSEDTRKLLSENHTGELNPFYGKKHSEESKRKIGESQRGKPSPKKGIPLSEETKNKISQGLTGRVFSEEHKRKIGLKHKGREVSEETRKRISESKTGVPNPRRGTTDEKIVCPHCQKSGGKSIMKRWHFDNCKEKGLD